MSNNIKRFIKIDTSNSSFLWGARRTGKSHWIRYNLRPEDIIFIDLLQTDIFAEYASKPSLIRERFLNTKKMIVIDEIQKVPALLDEIHWMMENKQIKFLLTGSSANCLN